MIYFTFNVYSKTHTTVTYLQPHLCIHITKKGTPLPLDQDLILAAMGGGLDTTFRKKGKKTIYKYILIIYSSILNKTKNGGEHCEVNDSNNVKNRMLGTDYKK